MGLMPKFGNTILLKRIYDVPHCLCLHGFIWAGEYDGV